MKKILLLGILTLSSLVMAGSYENMSSKELKNQINENKFEILDEMMTDHSNYSKVLILEKENAEIKKVLENRK